MKCISEYQGNKRPNAAKQSCAYLKLLSSYEICAYKQAKLLKILELGAYSSIEGSASPPKDRVNSSTEFHSNLISRNASVMYDS